MQLLAAQNRNHRSARFQEPRMNENLFDRRSALNAMAAAIFGAATAAHAEVAQLPADVSPSMLAPPVAVKPKTSRLPESVGLGQNTGDIADEDETRLQIDQQAVVGGTKIELPQYTEDGRMLDSKGYSDKVTYKILSEGPLTIQVPKRWKAQVSGQNVSLVDPLVGEVCKTIYFKSFDAPPGNKTVRDLGKPGFYNLTKVLDLPSYFNRADLIGAARREDEDDVKYVDYDLAIEPLNGCAGYNDLAGACQPETVVLLSCNIRFNKINVFWLEIGGQGQWKGGGKELKKVRSSFRVAG